MRGCIYIRSDLDLVFIEGRICIHFYRGSDPDEIFFIGLSYFREVTATKNSQQGLLSTTFLLDIHYTYKVPSWLTQEEVIPHPPPPPEDMPFTQLSSKSSIKPIKKG